jgi:ribosomal protein S18 acetylase RimI-like enzyme
MIASLRPAKLEDAPGIAKVHVDSWRSTYKGLIAEEYLAALSYERRTQAWSQNISNLQNGRFLFIAETRPGEIVGFVSAGPEHEGDPLYQAELDAIYLLQAAQGQGLGRKLVDMAMRALCQRGFSCMLLWVLKDNLPARKFYAALGGEYLRERPIKIGTQVLIEVAYGWKNILNNPKIQENFVI